MSNKIAKRGPIGSGPVKYEVHPDQPGTLSLHIDYEAAPVPQNFYVSDYFRVTPQDMVVLAEFGKLKSPDSTALRSKLEIYIPTQMFMNQFWFNSREFYKILKQSVTDSGYTALMPPAEVTDTDKVQTIHSNNILSVLSGGECMMDFFYISPRELWSKPLKQSGINMEALVRVICTPTLALGFFDACAPIADKIQSRSSIGIGVADALESK